MINTIKMFFGLCRPADLNHSFFGVLTFSKEKYRNQTFWVGHVIHNKESIRVRIFTERAPLSNSQKKFFQKAINDLGRIVKDSARFVESSFKIWCKKDYNDYFLNEFRCVSLDVPVDGDAMNDWQLTFARRSNEDLFFTVFMKHNKVDSTDLDA